MTGFLIVGCGQTKQLTEMHDTTAEMNETTKDLRDTSKGLGKTTNELLEVSKGLGSKMGGMEATTNGVGQTSNQMKETTNELSDFSRQGGGLQVRELAFKSLRESSSAAKKIKDAAAYFIAFDYQLWSGTGLDTDEARRLELMGRATSEFVKDVQECVVKGQDQANTLAEPDMSEPYAAGNTDACFNAFAVALHKENPKQNEMLKKFPKMKLVTMYSMIEDSLLAEKELNAGRLSLDKVPEYQREIMNNRGLAIRLLQARHNFAAGIFLSQTVPQNSLKDVVKAGLNKYLFGASWKLKMDSYNVSKLHEFSMFMKINLATKSLLRKIGVEPIVNSTVQQFFINLKPVLFDGVERSASTSAAQAELMSLIEEVRGKK